MPPALRPSRARTLYVLSIAGLAALAVRPSARVDRALDGALVPTRLLAELAAPLGWLQGRDVHAADPARRLRDRSEREEHRRLEAAVLRSADPTDPELAASVAGLRAVRAEVIERPDGQMDRVRLWLEDPTLVRDDYPVVCGDCFVGLVDLEATRGAHLPPEVVEARLVTGASFRVGAEVLSGGPGTDGGPQPCRLVVGGLAPRAGVFLDVHNPSDRSRRAGRVVVREPAGAGGRSDLANGFVLGELLLERVVPAGGDPERDGKDVLGIAPELDYATGLHQVLVLVPAEERAVRRDDGPDVFDDGRWLPARLFLRGDPSPWRAGRKLALGRRHGVERGAALASGARFAGRVVRAGLVTSDVSLVADPGLRVPAIALLQEGGVERPHVLGELTSLGGAGGEVRFLWPATVPLEGAAPRRARVWTGSGEGGVPRGLLIGDAELPAGAGPHVLHVTLPEGGDEPKGLAVRLSPTTVDAEPPVEER